MLVQHQLLMLVALVAAMPVAAVQLTPQLCLQPVPQAPASLQHLQPLADSQMPEPQAQILLADYRSKLKLKTTFT
jgi:hypothetical protein